MHVSLDGHAPVAELALEGLQEERSACVKRLHAVLEQHGADAEVQACLQRIDTINAALVRLASRFLTH